MYNKWVTVISALLFRIKDAYFENILSVKLSLKVTIL